MTIRLCLTCDIHLDAEVCPDCGTRTLLDTSQFKIADPRLGKVLDDRYRINRLIGRGGMGSVYEALRLSTKTLVAIKVLKAEFAENITAAKRFHQEAKAASLLAHPHSIRVFDFGQTLDGDLYMVRERLEGRSLGALLRREGRMEAPRAIKIASGIAQSLIEAHAQDLIHRDLKPDNIFLVRTSGDPDFVKVLDFGIAKFLRDSTSSGVTRTGEALGTPQYMSPEQTGALRDLTTAADIYSLGVMLFEVLAGSAPYDGGSDIEVMMKHLNEAVPDLPKGVVVPSTLRDLIARMMSKGPLERPSAEEVLEELEALGVAEIIRSAGERSDEARAPLGTPGPRVPLATPRSRALSATPEPRKRVVTRVETAELWSDEEAPKPAPRRAAIALGLGVLCVLALSLVYALFFTNEPGATKAPGKAKSGLGAQRAVPAVDSSAAWQGSDAGAQARAELPGPSAEVAKAARAPAPKPLAPAVARIHFDSTPAGALVTEGDKELGRTPFDLVLPIVDGMRRVSFAKDGYVKHATSFEALQDFEVSAILKKKTLETTPRSAPKETTLKRPPRPASTKKRKPEASKRRNDYEAIW